MNYTELAYRKTAVQGASGFGLLIALCDTLAGDLRRAAEAERNNDIEKRCREVNHGLLVIGFLQDSAERGKRGELSEKLIAFYSSLRRKMIQAQAKRSAEMLEEQMARVVDLRKLWHELEVRNQGTTETWNQSTGFLTSAAQYEYTASAWSA